MPFITLANSHSEMILSTDEAAKILQRNRCYDLEHNFQ